ncbi:conserved hypothetical protein [Blattabacterium sp. (Periplaneta americana) str. BPLAN]|uniref:hypothetical protein n=1 Tax=Blattabacterium sp. (Periplaneta americana) TaxID=367488 RepID=UPI0001BA0BB4|nr:hypothetical protein [Blattabacterium sp. (Periplaneta americana)]ACX83822.1 conserved hypothetical protein [Blattabacterium sp. (Periplaneta americana) str. BPLAN]
MNTSIRFLIPTIFLSLGVCLISCNDEITSADESGLKKDSPSIPPPDPSFASSNPTTPTPTPMPPSLPPDPSNGDQPSFSIPTDIDPEDLSKRIKEIGEKIERLEKESEFHHNEFYQMVGVQKGILNEVKRKKTVMKSKPYGSEEQLKAQKEFEDQKKLGKERLKILKEKNVFLSQLTKSITEAKNEQLALQKIQEDLQKRNKNKSTNKNENTDKTTTQDKKN